MKSIFLILISILVVSLASHGMATTYINNVPAENIMPSADTTNPQAANLIKRTNKHILNEGEYIKLIKQQVDSTKHATSAKFPKRHSKRCKHRSISFVHDTMELEHATPSNNNNPSISLPIPNRLNMNEGEWLFYRKLQRLKLA